MADLKYHKGDTIIIKDIVWYERNKDKQGRVIVGHESFIDQMAKFCGKVAHIVMVNLDSYDIDIDGNRFYWVDGFLQP